METLKKKTIIWEDNNEPPKNYIWVKSDGKAYEYNNSTRSWELSNTVGGSNGSGTDSNASHVYEVNSLEDIQNPKEGDIAIIPDSLRELTIEPTVTEDNGTITKVYNVESYSTNSRIRVTSDPTCNASNYIDSENNFHNSGSVSTSVFPIGTKSITLLETGEFPEVHFYEEVAGATKEYVNGEWVDRADFSSAIENMSYDEKMQIRKNLGLYCEDTQIGEKSAEYAGSTLVDPNYALCSTDSPQKSDLIKVVVGPKGQQGTEYQMDDSYVHIFDASYGYGIDFGNAYSEDYPYIKVVTVDNYTLSPGIYMNGMSELTRTAILYYNYPETVVNKIPEKYLPEQGSAELPWLNFPLFPLSNGIQDASPYISQEDWEKLINGKYTGIYVPENYGSFISEKYYPFVRAEKGANFGMISSVSSVVFCNSFENFAQFIVLKGENVTSIEFSRVTLPLEAPSTVLLSGLPQDTMTTQQELDDIGLTSAVIEKATQGQVFGFKYTPDNSTNNFYSLQVATKSLLETVIAFRDQTNQYKIVIGMITGVSVTVTPLS